jgi:DNA-binding transcriptional LysR family regulator
MRHGHNMDLPTVGNNCRNGHTIGAIFAPMDLNQLRVFQQVAQASSFARAAQALRMDRTRVSRVVSSLEQALGARLLIRTTRNVQLTAEGEALLRQITGPLHALEHAAAAVPAQRVVISGEVALTATADVARTLIAPLLPKFRARHPAVTVRMVLTDEVIGLSGGVELALRLGRPGGQSVVARKLRRLEAGFFAAPAYLERRIAPRELADLAGHERLWPVVRGKRSFAAGRPPPPPSIACNDFGTLAELACAGGGVALLPTFLAARHLTRGELVRVLPAVALRSAPLYLVSAPPAQLAARVLALRALLIDELAG